MIVPLKSRSAEDRARLVAPDRFPADSDRIVQGDKNDVDGKKNKSGGKPYAFKSLAAIDPAVFDQVMKDLYSGLMIIHDRDEEQARADMLKDGDRAELHTMSQLGSLHAEISNREGDGSVREIQNLENSETDAERRTAVGDTLLAQFVAQWGVSEKDVHDHTIESAVDLGPTFTVM